MYEKMKIKRNKQNNVYINHETDDQMVLTLFFVPCFRDNFMF